MPNGAVPGGLPLNPTGKRCRAIIVWCTFDALLYMGNHNSCASTSKHPGTADALTGVHTLTETRDWKPRAPGEARRAVLWSERRLTVAKMLHERLGDEAIWLEGEVLEIIIQLIPLAGLTVSVGAVGCDCETISAALDAAQPGDTIKVLPGLYREPIVLQPSPSAVTVLGAGTTPSDVVVEWGDESAESAGIDRAHHAGEVVENPATGSRRRAESSRGVAEHRLQLLEEMLQNEQQGGQDPTRVDKALQRLADRAGFSTSTRWIKYCSPLRSHASGAKVKNLTLRATGNSPAVFAESVFHHPTFDEFGSKPRP